MSRTADARTTPTFLTPAVADLTFEERASLTAGTDMWHTVGVDRLGIAGMGVTDGPSGARGASFTGPSSTLVPCGTALATTWNPALIRRVGELLGDEARSKDARVLLAPTVNIHRHPLGGRGFECYSEDPHLSAEIATAFIEGVQSRGVGCAVKHFVANDQETDRMSVDVVVDEQALREIYLVPFEAAVRRAGVWAVMAAYNRLGGSFCSEHHNLLNRILRDEWGFDGVVMSDWFGTRSVAAIEAGLDLEMPGPAQLLGHHLLAAVDRGQLTEGTVDRSADRMLLLMSRTTTSPCDLVDADRASTIGREAALEGIVLLSNNGVLPLDRPAVNRVAVIGPRAAFPHIQGGGSAQVTPPYAISPLRGIAARAVHASVRVVHEPGRADLGPRLINRGDLAIDENGQQGQVMVGFHALGDLDGPLLHREMVGETSLVWFGSPAPGIPPGRFSARATARFVPDSSGAWTFALSGLGSARLRIDGVHVLDTTRAAPGGGLLGLFSQPEIATIALVAGTTYEVVTEIDVDSGPPVQATEGGNNLPPLSLAGLTVQVTPPPQHDAVDRAIAAARGSDVAVVVVGHDAPDTEGLDHVSIDLPPDQVALIRQVVTANPATVVVVNTGSPVSTDWADDVAAVVQMSYLGQEAGAALAAVLFGDVDPSGRLPTSYPQRIEDTPAYGYFPGDQGRVTYGEGILVGYRHYDTHGIEPRFCFGHGLSYTTVAYGRPEVDMRGHMATVSFDVTNTGARPGHEVVQVYVRNLAAPRPRPDRDLRAFQKIVLDRDQSEHVTIELDERAFAYWDVASHEWRVAPGSYEILIGSSSRVIHHTIGVHLSEIEAPH